jgi:hypothetical protein
MGAALCFFTRVTLERAAFTLSCGGLWVYLSRRKIHSIDRDVAGLAPRETRNQ